MPTYKYLKDAVGALLFDDAAVTDEKKSFFISAANSALSECARFIDPITDSVCFSHRTSENLLDVSGGNLFFACGEDIVFTVENARSIYFQSEGSFSLSIKRGEETIVQRSYSALSRGFSDRRVLLNENADIKLIFTSSESFTLRNVAVYCESFSSEANIPAIGESVRYDAEELFRGENNQTSFLAFADFGVLTRINEDIPLCENADYRLCAGHYIVLDNMKNGTYRLKAKLRPLIIDEFTADGALLKVTYRAVDAAALFIAARLLREDEAVLAATYFNEYLRKKEEIIEKAKNELSLSAAVKLPGCYPGDCGGIL